MNIKIVNVLTHRYNYNFKQQLINMQFVFFSDSPLAIPSHTIQETEWEFLQCSFIKPVLRKLFLEEGLGKGVERFPPPPLPSFR